MVLTRARLRRKGKDQGGGALAACHSTAEALRLKTAKLLHEVRALHQCDVREVKITQDVILEPAGPFLVGPGQVQTARIAPETFLVIVVVVVDGGLLCKKEEDLFLKSGI